jgi:hypothetical protein
MNWKRSMGMQKRSADAAFDHRPEACRQRTRAVLDHYLTSKPCADRSVRSLPICPLMQRVVRFDSATVRDRPKIAPSPRSLPIGQGGVEGPAGEDALDVGSDLVAGLSARHA